MLLYDDTYFGPRWRYGLQYRGITNYMGCQDGETVIPWIVFSGAKSDDPRFNFGTYDSAVELSPQTVAMLQLIPLGMVDDGSSDEHPNLTAQLL